MTDRHFYFNLKQRLTNHGQVAIVVILIVTALAVIGITLAARTTKENLITTQTKESSVVLSSAESGAEKALSQVMSVLESGGEINTKPQTMTVTTEDGVQVEVSYQVNPLNYIQTKVPAGKTVLVDLRDKTSKQPAYDGDLEIKWAKETDCSSRAALIITRYYQDTQGKIRADYQAVAPGCSGRQDNFIQAGDLASDGDYHHVFTLTGLTSGSGNGGGDLLITVKPIYADADLMIEGVSGSLPVVEQYSIESRGVNQDDTTQETRAIRIDYTLPVPPFIMDYAVYSGDSLAK